MPKKKAVKGKTQSITFTDDNFEWLDDRIKETMRSITAEVNYLLKQIREKDAA